MKKDITQKIHVNPLDPLPKTEPIAIIGIGCRFPGSVNSPKDFWKLLFEGKNGIKEIPKSRWSKRLLYHPDKNRIDKIYSPRGGFLDNIDQFDPEFFGISPREAAFMDPQQRLLLETTWEAIEDAGIDPRSLAGSKTGVFIGIFMHDYENIHCKPTERKIRGPHSATGMSTTIAANRLSYVYDFRGPSMVIDTACSSSLITIHLACQSLKNNESELAVAGGANVLINPEITMSLCSASMLSPDGYCKAFDARANGYTRAEGTGIVVLKPLSKALENNNPIYAIIKGSATNQDGRSDGQTVPSSDAQQIAIEEALRKADLNPNDIQYFEAHGTGTAVGDPTEANALGTVLSKGRVDKDYCIIGSVKTNIGHTESAAGVAGLIKATLMLKNKKIPPNLHFETPNPNIPFEKLKLRIPTSLEDWNTKDSKLRVAGVNSFGFGGSNACTILEEFIEPINNSIDSRKSYELDADKGKKNLVALSGHTPEALQAVVTSYINFLNSEECDQDITLSDIGYTSFLRKGHHIHRLTIAADSKDEFKKYLQVYSDGEKRTGMSSGNIEQVGSKKLVFVFSGMGQQWWAMGKQLLREEPEFRKVIEKCNTLFKKHTEEWSLLEELTKDEKESRINETQIAQPCIFSLQTALVALWRSQGIIPDAIVGHSVGEVAAAYAAGALSLDDAIKVCYNRSRLQQRTAGQGKMLAVGLSAQKTEEVLAFYEGEVSIAVINSPSSVTISGIIKPLEDIADALESEEIFARFLKVEVPYHSSVMDSIVPELGDSLKTLKPRESRIPFFSTVTGDIIKGEKLDGQYWCRNARETVSFGKAINELIQTDHKIFLEIGAHPVLTISIKECLDSSGEKGMVLPSLRRKEAEKLTLLSSLGQLYCIGYPIDWKLFYRGSEKFVKLPNYPWQKKSYWNESNKSKKTRIGEQDKKAIHPLIGEQIDMGVPTWSNELDLWQLPYLNDHVIQGSIIYPGAAYIEMGIAAAKEKFGDVPFTLENIEIKAPLLLSDDIDSTVQISLEEDNTFSIYSKKS